MSTLIAPSDPATAPVSPAGGRPQPKVAQPGAPLDADAIRSGSVALTAAAAPTTGPSEGPDSPVPTPGPGPGPTDTDTSGTPAPTPSPTPGPTTGGSAAGITNGEGFAAAAASSFFDLIRNASSPDALEAQNIILRRIALEGDVVPSRIFAPRNVTELAGWINLLTEYNELEMRSQALAGILGVAGPNPPLGWTAPASGLGFRALMNDRPAGPAQATLPVTVMVRTDFYDPLSAALATLHQQGCTLPLLSGPLALPTAGGGTTLFDPLDYIGRILRLAPNQALTDPATDPLALVRVAGSSDSFAVASRSLAPGSVAVVPADYDALQLSSGYLAVTSLSATPLVMVGPILAAAGYVATGAIPVAGAPPNEDWSRFSNIAGLIPDQTRLGDELALLHTKSEIASSVFAGMQDWRWRGSVFAP